MPFSLHEEKRERKKGDGFIFGVNLYEKIMKNISDPFSLICLLGESSQSCRPTS